MIGDRLLPALRTFFDRYRDEAATLEDFEATMAEIAGVDLARFCEDWLRGAASSAFLEQEVGERALAAELACRYETSR